MLVPTVIESTNRGERAYDIYSRLLANRIVFLGTAIDDQVSNLVIAQLLHLESESTEHDVAMYINSPGGDMTGLFAIHDTMQYIAPDVATICVGQAASAAAVLLAAGAKGKRYVLPERAGARAPAARRRAGPERRHGDRGRRDGRDAASHGRHPRRRPPVRRRQRIATDMDRDFILRGDRAVEYGLVDSVIDRRQLADPMVAAA